MGLFEAMRENTKVILWITVIAFVGLIFLAWGANFSTRSGGGSYEAGILGAVNGEKIRREVFSDAFQQARLLYEQSIGANFTSKPAASSGAWVKMALRMDYSAKTWSLWMNGTNIFSEFDFLDAGRDVFSRVTLSVGAATTTHVDDVKATFDGREKE